MPVIKFFKSLTPLGRIVSALITVALVVLVFTFVRDLVVGNAEVIAEIDSERAGAAVRTAQETFNDLAELDEAREQSRSVVESTKVEIAQAPTQAEKEAIATAALCELDPAYCPEEE